jgi:DNA-directed RNA polymerase subunit alpha
MNKVNCLEKFLDKNNNAYGCFIIEPLEIGQGITLGNALRRTILSDLSSYAITGVRINNLKHEFSAIEGVREDVLEILLNIKEILFKQSLLHSFESIKLKGFLNARGPKIITAGMLKIPDKIITVLNPNHYLCTLVDNSEFYLEIDIERGKGYKLKEEFLKYSQEISIFSKRYPSTLFIDTIFLPIKKVNYKVKLIHDTQGNIKESLTMEILTNGSISPKRALKEGMKIILDLFSSFFLSTNNLTLLEEIN